MGRVGGRGKITGRGGRGSRGRRGCRGRRFTLITSPTSTSLSTSAFCATFSPMTDRRSFISTFGAALLGAACSRVGGSSSESARRLDRIGVQLYTVRGDLARDFEGTLSRIAEIGYRELEFAGYHGKSPSEVCTIITLLGLNETSSTDSLVDFRMELTGQCSAS